MYNVYTEEPPSLTTVSHCWKLWSFSGTVGHAPEQVSSSRGREKHSSFPFSIQISCPGIELKHILKPLSTITTVFYSFTVIKVFFLNDRNSDIVTLAQPILTHKGK